MVAKPSDREVREPIGASDGKLGRFCPVSGETDFLPVAYAPDCADVPSGSIAVGATAIAGYFGGVPVGRKIVSLPRELPGRLAGLSSC